MLYFVGTALGIMTTEDAKILLVDDDPQVLGVYRQFLEKDYAVETAENGHEALELIDDEVDLVMLDRRMPGLSGGEVLAEIRDRGFDCPVVMVTAIDPGVDIITMSFNDYLIKPVSEEELLNTVDRTLALAQRDVQMQEYFSLVAKQSALESEYYGQELASNESYQALKDRIDDLRNRIDPPIAEFEDDLAFRLSEGT